MPVFKQFTQSLRQSVTQALAEMVFMFLLENPQIDHQQSDQRQ